ncbi:hypothetical protein DACRYDRAFT_22400 [Dacryopinax primogenitus]|uniref:Arrestin-like N-terminal domain-containing protein n=1 Tax=Dacryopinax primogenitus (strain DJM 731) TaxID=1858805 RepID=M5GCV7_DACPD|nr:uncharacterized protein DACRYDRAFT_22400 [Dacryopinax primogenitus]EJU01998.1 hypothetical protein DACRYDRAFT_22400 [Dacryopinax primogenitus]
MPSTPSRSHENDIIGTNPPRGDRFDIGTYTDFITLYAETEEILLSPQDFPTILAESSTVNLPNGEWLSLTLTGIWGTCGHGHQIFHAGTAVEGSVELDMQYAHMAKGLVVEIVGFVKTFVGDELYFLRWKKPFSSGRFDSNMKKCVLPFSFTLPEYCTQGPTAIKLPPSFNNTDGDPGLGPQAIQYRCQVKVPTSKWFADKTLYQTFHFLPRTRPVQVTAEHEEDLYQKFTNTISGIIFGQRNVQVQCVLSLSRPLVYSRGESIKFILSLSSSDPQALDLLSSAEAISVWLQRNVRTVAPARYDVVSDLSNNCSRRVVDAVIERARETSCENMRVWKGFIPVDEGLAPHYFFPSLSVIYGISVMIQTTGFMMTSSTEDPESYVRELLMFAQLVDLPDEALADKPIFLVPVGIATDTAHVALPRWSAPTEPPPYQV